MLRTGYPSVAVDVDVNEPAIDGSASGQRRKEALGASGVDPKSGQGASPGQMVRTADPTGALRGRVRCADLPRDGWAYDQGCASQLIGESR